MARTRKTATRMRNPAHRVNEPELPWNEVSGSVVTRVGPYDDEELEAPEATREIGGVPAQVPIRTEYSSQAALIAELVRDKFDGRNFGRAPFRLLRIDEPEGPSTAGGRLARQSVSLVSRKGSVPTIVCGWVDTSCQEAHLRSFESVARRYEARHGTAVDVSPQEYEYLLDELVRSLLAGGMKVRVLVPDETLESEAPEQARAEQPAPRSGFGGWALLLTFLLGMLAGRWVPWERLAPLWEQLNALLPR